MNKNDEIAALILFLLTNKKGDAVALSTIIPSINYQSVNTKIKGIIARIPIILRLTSSEREKLHITVWMCKYVYDLFFVRSKIIQESKFFCKVSFFKNILLWKKKKRF